MLRTVGEGLVLRHGGDGRSGLRLPVIKTRQRAQSAADAVAGWAAVMLDTEPGRIGESMISPGEEASLWEDYRTQLFGFVLRRVEDGDTAEDIVHDVLVRAYQKHDTLRDGQKFEQWLYQITRNAIIDYYRARKPSERLPVDLPGWEADSGSARRELAECMRPLAESLPDHYRNAIVLAELEGLTQRETADRLGLSLSGAKSRVQRARRLLEEKLLECCRVELDGRGAIVDFESRNGCAPGAADSGDSACGDC